MRRKIILIAGAIVLLVFVLGTVFAFLRPEYTREAVDILFRSELMLHPEELPPGQQPPAQEGP